MAKVKSPDRSFIYFSPLKNCENEKAKLIASLIEQFLMNNIEIQIEITQCKVEQIYKHADEFMKGNNRWHI